MATLQTTISALDRLFAIFNQRYFENSLVPPVIVVQSHGRENLVMGWCTTKRIWRDSGTSDTYYEITICPEFFDRTIYEICGTLLHEMAHLYDLQNGIQDCSRGNTYHNKRFKQRAEQCGLIVEYNSKLGWAITRPTEETIAYIDSLKLNKFDFALERMRVIRATPGSEKKKSRKYVCPNCGNSVRATKEVNISCLDCETEMIET